MTAPKLTGRVAIVTGGGGDIGRAIAELFVQEGAAVLCADIDGKAAADAAKRLTAAGGRALAVECDVSDSESARSTVATAVRHFGKLHILVNCAAVFPPRKPVTALDGSDWERALAVNVSGCFYMSKHAILEIAKAGGGSIVHVASQLAHVAREGSAAYCTTKAALLGLAKVMALDHAKDGIRVNTLSPGGVATTGMAEQWGGMETAEREWGRAKHPLGRLCRVEEVARGALFLASDDSSCMTGADLLIDGGYTAL
ncbi:MAG: SDR family oxidoreductase [Rhodospirillales bacterium]|nr:SDR family oxidoreductase [Rhodospirillales bacterium]